MKKRLIMLLMITAVVSSGCAMGVELTDENSDLVAEYTASIILKNDQRHEYRLIDVSSEETKNPEVEAPTQAPQANETGSPSMQPAQPTDEPAANTEQEVGSFTLEELMGLKNATLTYKELKLMDSYTDKKNTTYSLTAKKGYQFAVLSFSITNTGKKEQQIDLLSKKMKYNLNVNGTESYSAILTVLDSDLQCYIETLQAGETKEAVLLFEVEENKQIPSATLFALNGKKASEIEVK